MTPDRLSRSPGIASRSIFSPPPAFNVTSFTRKSYLLDGHVRSSAVESSDVGVCEVGVSLPNTKDGVSVWSRGSLTMEPPYYIFGEKSGYPRAAVPGRLIIENRWLELRNLRPSKHLLPDAIDGRRSRVGD